MKIALVLLLLAGPASAGTEPAGPVAVPAAVGPTESVARRIIMFRDGTPKAVRDAAAARLGGGAAELWLIDAVAVAAPKVRMAAAELALRADPAVEAIEEDLPRNFLLQREPSLPWGIERVHAKAAWSVARGEGIKVAVVDTGIDSQHRALKVAGGYNSIAPGTSHQDEHGHGTHVAGTIAAQDVGMGVIGVAPGVELYSVRVTNKDGWASNASIIGGLQWCVENGIDIANLSLGSDQASKALEKAVRNAAALGLAIVAAAGNSGGPVVYPAAYPQTIAVGAMDRKGAVPDWSSRGPEVDLIAPGVDIRSTKLGGGATFKSGTSMAAPHAAGLAALAASAHGLRGVEALREHLQKSSRKLPSAPEEAQGAGLPDARQVVAGREVSALWNTGSAAFDAVSYAAGDTAKIAVEDRDMNLDPEALDSISVAVYSDTDRAGITASATETGAATGVFAAAITFTETRNSRGDRLRVSAGDVVYAVYVDHTLPPPYGSGSRLRVTAEAQYRPLSPFFAATNQEPRR